MRTFVMPFAGVDDVGISDRELHAELRAELLRDARFLLAEWERYGAEETKGRLLQVLDHLALLVRAGRSIE